MITITRKLWQVHLADDASGSSAFVEWWAHSAWSTNAGGLVISNPDPDDEGEWNAVVMYAPGYWQSCVMMKEED